MKKQILALTDNFIFEGVVSIIDKLYREPPNLLRVLTYHRINNFVNCQNLDPSLLSATPQAFEQQMIYIKKHFQPVSIQDVLAYYNNNSTLPKRSVLITFDDAYQDFEKYAWPILKQQKIPTTLFVPTAFPDNPDCQLWWDQLYNTLKNTTKTQIETPIGNFILKSMKQKSIAYKRLRDYIKSTPHSEAMAWTTSFCQSLGIESLPENSILGWEKLQKLSNEGVTMAAHTHTHPMLNQINSKLARIETLKSQTILKEKCNNIESVFAYPGGQVSNKVVELLREEGFKVAFTTKRGINDLTKTNPLLLKRINIGRSTNLGILRLQLLPLFAHF